MTGAARTLSRPRFVANRDVADHRGANRELSPTFVADRGSPARLATKWG